MLRRIAGPQLTVLLVVIIVAGWLARGEMLLRDSPLEHHDSNDRAEDRIPDPLIVSGRGLLPLVLTEVQSRDMRLRRYAIGFPGSGGDPEALDELESIVSDVQESHHVRADALLAIFHIAPVRAREIALQYVGAGGVLGWFAGEIANGKGPIYRTPTDHGSRFTDHGSRSLNGEST